MLAFIQISPLPYTLPDDEAAVIVPPSHNEILQGSVDGGANAMAGTSGSTRRSWFRDRLASLALQLRSHF